MNSPRAIPSGPPPRFTITMPIKNRLVKMTTIPAKVTFILFMPTTFNAFAGNVRRSIRIREYLRFRGSFWEDNIRTV